MKLDGLKCKVTWNEIDFPWPLNWKSVISNCQERLRYVPIVRFKRIIERKRKENLGFYYYDPT